MRTVSMKLINGWSLFCVMPIATLFPLAARWFPTDGSSVRGAESRSPDVSDLSVGVKNKPVYRFTEDDIAPIVAAMNNAGIDNFVCWINPQTGALNVTTAVDSKPHLDILPGHCPNNVTVNDNGCGDGDSGVGGDDDLARVRANTLVPTVNVGLLGNAFDVTQVNLGSVRLSLVNLNVDGGEIAPLNAVFQDVGTPFEGTSCHCTSAGPDGILDISMLFDKQEMIDTFGLNDFPNHAQVPVKSTGMLNDGEAIFGVRDCIRVVKD
jgi:hypothetical protein